MKIRCVIPALLCLVVLAPPSRADVTLLARGSLEPLTPLTHAIGNVQIWEDSESGAQWVQFGPDYKMSSGVIFDLKVCGMVSEEESQRVCLSEGEVRKLSGEYRMPIRWKLARYEKIKIFDVDVVQDQAQAILQSP
jgi:hypothetical protein